MMGWFGTQRGTLGGVATRRGAAGMVGVGVLYPWDGRGHGVYWAKGRHGGPMQTVIVETVGKSGFRIWINTLEGFATRRLS